MFSKSLIVQLNTQLENILGSLQYLTPELLLTSLFVLVIILDLVFSTRQNLKVYKNELLWWLSFAGLLLVIATLYSQYSLVSQSPKTGLFMGLIHLDTLSINFRMIISFTGLLTLLVSRNSRLFVSVTPLKTFRYRGEYFTLLLAILLGLHLLTMTSNLLLLYVSIELVSISSYILTIFYFDKKGIEGALKYLLFGAFASGLMIYGMSWLYGLSGSLEIDGFVANITTQASTLNTIAALLVVAGILFKISAVPFHFWAPDAYQVAPTPVVAFFSIAPKAALLAVLVKLSPVLTTLFVQASTNSFAQQLILLFGVIAIATVLVGNLSALWQQNAKRLLAYSTIAHIGVLLMGWIDLRAISTTYIAFYLATYALMNFGAFLGIEMVARNFQDEEDPYALKHYKGIGIKYPLIGVCMLVLMVALTGLPPTVGFQAKLFIFSGLWENYQAQQALPIYLYALIAAVFTTAVALFYYLRIPFFMFFKSGEDQRTMNFSFFDQILLVFFTIIVVVLFFKADVLFGWLS